MLREKKRKKTLAFLLACLLAAVCPACGGEGGGGGGNGGGGGSSAAGYSISDFTESVELVGFLTGDRSPNNGSAMVGGTDLGFPIYDAAADRMYFAFGDTFSSPDISSAPLWRSNVLSHTNAFSDKDLSKGITFDGWLANSAGVAQVVIQGYHTSDAQNYEVTKIPTGGIVLGDSIYLFYMSVRAWGAGGWWDCNYNGAIRSRDGGTTWERVYDLTWAETDTGKYASQIKELAQETVGQTPGPAELDLSARVAPNFMQITPVDGRDGYVYLFGIAGGRQSGQKMARVRKEDFENFSAYEYFTGYNAAGVPQWTKGSAGLAAIRSSERSFVISERMGEATCYYNEHLGKWVMTDNIDNKIYMAMSKNVYGPYSPKYAILDTSYPFAEEGVEGDFSSLYAGFSHEMLTEEDGRTMYLIVSYYAPVYNSAVMKVRFWE